MSLCYLDSSDKNYWKNCYLDIFFSGYLLLITQIGSLFFWCSNLMYNDTSSEIFFVMLWMFLICFTWKKSEK